MFLLYFFKYIKRWFNDGLEFFLFFNFYIYKLLLVFFSCFFLSFCNDCKNKLRIHFLIFLDKVGFIL
jgi:hypothetical protein